MTDRELMQQALDALEKLNKDGWILADFEDEVYASIEALRARLAQPERKLWLWKNFVDGKPEYWAFDNPYPTNLDNGDPQTLGQPCGYAIFKSSRDGSCGRTEEQVLREMKSVSTPPQREWQGLTDEEYTTLMQQADHDAAKTGSVFLNLRYAIEVKLKEKNIG